MYSFSKPSCTVNHLNLLAVGLCLLKLMKLLYPTVSDGKLASNIQGQIRVGSGYQAKLPECNDGRRPVDDNSWDNREQIRWTPGAISDSDVLVYLQAARSMAALVGMCDPATSLSEQDRCQAASQDCTTVNALDIVSLP